MDLENDLNPQQREAVYHTGGPLLVLAGAGSGKTRALTYRIVHLIRSRRVPPDRILAITFTNKAAEEMRNRVHKLLGSDSAGMWIGTFHATCARILRRHIDRLGYRNDFVIYDDSDQARVIRTCLKRVPEAEKRIRLRAVQSIVDSAKNQGLDPLEATLPDSVARPYLKTILADYARSLREANALDFGDLILLTLRLLDEHPDILQAYQRRFQAVLVDEYQDTNRAQHLLLQKLVPRGADLCVVGDDDQSIYRWRGAEVNNLLEFEKDFPGVRVLTLEENYRSTQTILRAAEAVASGNPRRRPKHLWTRNEMGEPIRYAELPTPDQEAAFVVTEIQKIVGEGIARYGDIGVFFRTNAQSRPFEEAFLLYRIPHAVIGAIRFYERAEVKDLISYLRFLYNPDDTVSLTRILNRPPRGIGTATQAALQSHADRNGITLWEAIEGALRQGFLSGAPRRRLEEFHELIRELRQAKVREVAPEALLRTVIDRIGYRTFLEAQPDGERRWENVQEFVNAAARFRISGEESEPRDLLGAFLQRVTLVSEADRYGERADSVYLMTLHCAKGLEFPVVFLTGMEDGVLPHVRSYASQENLDEELRLCYVGMTRAKERLYLTRAWTRPHQGSEQPTRPSPFLAAIPPELIETLPAREYPLAGANQHAPDGDVILDHTTSQLASPGPSQAQARERDRRFRVGDRIEHETLGVGTVRRVEGEGAREKLTVQFWEAGIRKLMASISPIRKLP